VRLVMAKFLRRQCRSLQGWREVDPEWAKALFDGSSLRPRRLSADWRVWRRHPL